jgi:hypothetical protein
LASIRVQVKGAISGYMPPCTDSVLILPMRHGFSLNKMALDVMLRRLAFLPMQGLTNRAHAALQPLQLGR